MGTGFSRIAVINRGEAAMRLINAVRELRYEHEIDLRTIALHTAAERSAMFVREADEAVCIDAGRVPDAGSPYLDMEVLERAMVEARADAAWVGWGFVAERPEFAELCVRLGIVFIGPRPEVMRRLGDKIEAKLLAERAEVPVAPWSGGPVETIDDAREHAAAIGFPLMIKATAGGGGRGIRRVDEPGGLEEAFVSARSEGLKAFGDATVFMERVVTGARHVEVQVIGDTHGTVWAVGVRDCSMQRRNQKVIEESQCIALTPQQDRDLRAAAVRLATLAGYENAGTVEFLYQPIEKTFAFLEVNTRLQVEHPITELTTGLDLVKLQLEVARGGTLSGDVPPTVGFAIEARLNAEDPQRGFAPAPGVIETLSIPVGAGIRVDTGVAEGDEIPPEFDSMIAKVIAVGADRDEALSRLHRALSQMTVLVRGGTTNKSFLLDLLSRAEVRAGDIDTAWLDRLTSSGDHVPHRLSDVALVVAALDAAEINAEAELAAFFGSAARGRPDADTGVGRTVELRHGGSSYAVRVCNILPGRYELELDGTTVATDVERLGHARSRLRIGSAFHRVVSATDGTEQLVEVDGVMHRFSRDDAGLVRAPAASLVVRVDVAVDDIVTAGQRIVVVEAMKMEVAIDAPVSGRIRDIFVTPNSQATAGSPLCRIEPDTEGEAGETDRQRIGFANLAEQQRSADTSTTTAADLVRAAILGFDVGSQRALQSVSPDEETASLLDSYVEVCALDPERLEATSDGRGGAREYFNSYLRSLDAEREGLPDWYRDRLSRALQQYGIDSLDDTAHLRRALHRIYVSQQRRATQTPIVVALLEDPPSTPALRAALDRLIDVTRRRHPALAATSRSLRHRLFDRPHIELAHAAVSATMTDLAREVVSSPERTEQMERLVDCPLPLVPVLAESRLLESGATSPLVEVLLRRYYRIRDLGPVAIDTTDDVEVCRAMYVRHGRRVHVLGACVEPGRVGDGLHAIADLAADVEAPDTAVVDLVVPVANGAGRRAGPVDTDGFADEMAEALSRTGLPLSVRRVAVIPADAERMVEVVTFRRPDETGRRPYWMAEPAPADPNADGREAVSAEVERAIDPNLFEEDIKFRGLHPMIARRLQMWRLSNFDIRPLPAAGEVHLFDCTARVNPSDRRLVAVAEVRDITPVRDDEGRIMALPEVEHLLVGCLDAIRRARSDLTAATLEWNRVMLHVWPTVDLPPGELDEVARRLAPLTEGLGLEQVVVSGRLAAAGGADAVDAFMRIGYEPGRGVTVRLTDPATEPMQPLDDYTRKLIATRRRGLTYPYEIVPMLSGPRGSFVEYDLDEAGGDGDRLVPVDRPAGGNTAGVVVGVVSTPTQRYPEGITRVAVLGDPTKAMGSITEAECRRLLAAIDLAERLDAPIEWMALSAGAKIAMDSGSENLDWVARVLRRIVEHTQAGGEINIVVAGINVGAQPYWNAESTMLMHTSGILVMTPDSAMVLTGKQAIDYSGGVSAENNIGIGGYERVMGPNGEAQFWAPSLAEACAIVFRHYELTYRAPGERWPRSAALADPFARDVRSSPHHVDGIEFTTVGDIFSAETNPDRKKPFDIRAVMDAVIDADSPSLERWPEMVDAETAVVYECRLGGAGITMIGMESRPVPRHGAIPADGPAQWSAGTLFPLSSKKVARAINSASGSRPVVMLANLSGFDGSPESLRRLQLEYGAEIGRAIVNFDGPFTLCVISRYHGGAFVVFSATLNDRMEVIAVEGSHASVIGGAPAAAVVFTRDVDARMRSDPRVVALDEAIVAAAERDEGDEAARLRAQLSAVREAVRTEKMGEVAAEFDAVHSVERARSVGSVHRIIAAADLRPELIASLERGMAL